MKKIIFTLFFVPAVLIGYLVFISFGFNQGKVQSASEFSLPVVIVEDGQTEINCLSSREDLEEVLGDCGYKVYKEDIVDSLIDPELGLGSYISVKRATPVYIRDGAEEEFLVRTQLETVAQLLSEQEITVGKEDKLRPSKDEKVEPFTKIEIDRYGTKEVKESEPIAYSTIRKPDPDTQIGTSYVGRSGEQGKLVKTYKVYLVNNQEKDRELIEEEVVEEPVEEIVYYGTMPSVISTKYGEISFINEINGSSMTASSYYDTGDKIKITNLNNGKSVIVIVDSGCPWCGPIDKNRIVDLEKNAFAELVEGSIWDVGVIANAKIEHLAY